MTFEQQRTTVERDVERDVAAPARVGERRVHTDQIVEQRDTSVYRPSGSTLAARVIVVVFGIIQTLLVVRIVLLALDARQGNDLVSTILNASQLFVAPFEGVFRTDALAGGGGSVLDVAAITALVALTLVELVILAIVRIPRRSEAV